MTKLTTDDVLRLAKLSQLKLTDEEVKKFADEITDILHYVEQLQSVDLSEYEPTSQVSGLVNVSRPDEVVDYGPDPEELLKNSPDNENGSFKVKRMVQ